MDLANVRLTGVSLKVARLVWMALALATLGLVLYSAARGQQYFDILKGYNWTREAYLAALTQLSVPESALDLLLALSVSFGRVIFLAMSALLIWRSTEPVVYFTAVMLLTFMSTATGLAFLTDDGPVLMVVVKFLLATGQFCLLLFFFIFPNGRFVPGWLAWPSLAAVFIVGVAGHINPGFMATPLGGVVGVVAILWALVVPVVSQVYRYRRVSSPLERQQTKLVLFGMAMWLVFGVGSWVFEYFVAPAFGPGLLPPIGTGGRLVYYIAINEMQILPPIAVPLTIGIAILRYRLFDIDVIIRRTLVYSALTGLLALAYFGSVLVLQSIFQAITGEGRNALVTVLSTLLIAALFVPLRSRVQRAIDRRFYRQKYDAARTLAAFGAQARDVVALEQLSDQLVGAVDETMQPAHVGLWVRAGRKR